MCIRDRLYIASTTSNAYPEPTNLTERTLRMTFMDSENYKEVIFPETRKAGAYGIQRKSIPFFPRGSWNGIAPTITTVSYTHLDVYKRQVLK